MNLPKKIVALSFSALLLAACGNDTSTTVNNTAETDKIPQNVQKIEKNKTAKLPLEIFKDSSYKVEGEIFTFTRTVEKVVLKNFDDDNILEFYNRYDNYVREQNVDLKNNYMLLEIDVRHSLDKQARRKQQESFIFNEGSGLVIGDRELGKDDEFLNHQQKYITKNYNVNSTSKDTGNVLLAVPIEYLQGDLLQFKFIQKLNSEDSVSYIDVQ